MCSQSEMPKFSVFRPLARRIKQNLFFNLHVLCTVADAEKKGTVDLPAI